MYGSQNMLLGVTRIILEISALWTALGYLSLRAFCNFSGLPLIDSVSFERYLEETYYLFTTVAVGVATDPFFLIALLFCCAASVAAVFVRKRRAAQTATTPRWVNTAWLLPAWVLVCAFGYAALSAYLGRLPQDLLVGKLVATKLQDHGTGHFYLAIALALFACAGVWLLRQPRRKGLRGPVEWSRHVLFAALGLLAVLSVMNIPILFGASLANREVHVVRLYLEGAANSVCVARILQSPTQLLYWRSEQQWGLVESVPVSQIRAVNYVRSANLLGMASGALTLQQPQPTCNESPGGAK